MKNGKVISAIYPGFHCVASGLRLLFRGIQAGLTNRLRRIQADLTSHLAKQMFALPYPQT
jgi:hypothetical protein